MCIYIYMYNVYIYIYMCVCMYVYLYIYMIICALEVNHYLRSGGPFWMMISPYLKNGGS